VEMLGGEATGSVVLDGDDRSSSAVCV